MAAGLGMVSCELKHVVADSMYVGLSYIEELVNEPLKRLPLSVMQGDIEQHLRALAGLPENGLDTLSLKMRTTSIVDPHQGVSAVRLFREASRSTQMGGKHMGW